MIKLFYIDILLQEFPDFADKIPIRGDDNSWNYDGRGAKEGKQKHMASAAEQLWENSGNIITRKSTLLLDDDKNNIVIARKNEVQAVLIEPNNIQKYIYLHVYYLFLFTSIFLILLIDQ